MKLWGIFVGAKDLVYFVVESRCMLFPVPIFFSTSGTSSNKVKTRARIGKDFLFKKRKFKELFDYFRYIYIYIYIPDFMKTGLTTQNAISITIALFAGNLPQHPKLLPSNSQFESCVYIPCLQGHLKASCSLQLKSDKTNAAISTHSSKKILSTTLVLYN